MRVYYKSFLRNNLLEFVPARDSRKLSILKKGPCDKSATKYIAIQVDGIHRKSLFLYMFILYKLFTRVFEFQLMLRDNIFRFRKLALSVPC